MRTITRAVAFDPGGWTAARQAEVMELFDSLADGWHTRDAPGREAPLIDALDRGLPAAAGAFEALRLQAAVLSASTTEVPVVSADGPPPIAARPGFVSGGPIRRPPTADDLLARLTDERNQTAAPLLEDDDPFSGPSVEHAAATARSSHRVCVDVGAAIGLASQILADRFPAVVSVDLSSEMLALAPSEPALRVQADASRLPFDAGQVDVLVLSNAFLFPTEVDRALAPEGVVVWVSSRGPDTPIYLSADDVSQALPGEWDGVASQAGWGTWSVHWRTPA